MYIIDIFWRFGVVLDSVNMALGDENDNIDQMFEKYNLKSDEIYAKYYSTLKQLIHKIGFDLSYHAFPYIVYYHKKLKCHFNATLDDITAKTVPICSITLYNKEHIVQEKADILH